MEHKISNRIKRGNYTKPSLLSTGKSKNPRHTASGGEVIAKILFYLFHRFATALLWYRRDFSAFFTLVSIFFFRTATASFTHTFHLLPGQKSFANLYHIRVKKTNSARICFLCSSPKKEDGKCPGETGQWFPCAYITRPRTCLISLPATCIKCRRIVFTQFPARILHCFVF